MDAETIAKGLTEEQKRWITMQGAEWRCKRRLIDLGLIRRMWPGPGSGYEVTPTGLQVRAILKGE